MKHHLLEIELLVKINLAELNQMALFLYRNSINLDYFYDMYQNNPLFYSREYRIACTYRLMSCAHYSFLPLQFKHSLAKQARASIVEFECGLSRGNRFCKDYRVPRVKGSVS
jgi:hypothetical protein